MASDGTNTSELVVPINVKNTTPKPTIQAPDKLTASEGDEIKFSVVAKNELSEQIKAVSDNIPNGANYDESTGEFVWTPAYDYVPKDKDTEIITLTFLASNGGQELSKDIVITVKNKNRAPQISDLDLQQQVEEGETISFEITARDLDGDPVTLTINTDDVPYKDLAEIRNNSVFFFDTNLLPDDRPIESAVFRIVASDGKGGQDSKSVEIAITRTQQVDDFASFSSSSLGMSVGLAGSGTGTGGGFGGDSLFNFRYGNRCR